MALDTSTQSRIEPNKCTQFWQHRSQVTARACDKRLKVTIRLDGTQGQLATNRLRICAWR